MTKVKHLDLVGLQQFKGLIEGKISASEAKALKTALFDEASRKINFYKKQNATLADVADFSVTLPAEQDISGLLEKIAGGTKGNVVTIGEGGVVVDSGISASTVATKAEVKTVSDKVGDVTGLITTAKENVVGAINELKSDITSNAEVGTVTISAEVTTAGALKSYTVKQGSKTVGVIDIPKDLVVSEGSVVKDPEGQAKGTYIKLVIANQTTPLYINVGTLIDIYVAKAEATQIQLAINPSTREISATIVAGSVGTTELADSAVTTVKIADANVTLAKLAVDVKNAFDAAGSASAAERNAKTYTDGLNTTMSGKVTALESKVGDGFEAITAEEINAMFAS